MISKQLIYSFYTIIIFKILIFFSNSCLIFSWFFLKKSNDFHEFWVKKICFLRKRLIFSLYFPDFFRKYQEFFLRKYQAFPVGCSIVSFYLVLWIEIFKNYSQVDLFEYFWTLLNIAHCLKIAFEIPMILLFIRYIV